MKILFVLHGFPPECRGGTERTVEALARAMVAVGHDVLVVCGSLGVGAPDRVDEFEHNGVRVKRVHRDDLDFENWFKTYHPGVSRTLHRIMQEERPDVVHVHHWLRLTSDVLRIARELGAFTVVTIHDYFTVLARAVRRFGDDEVRAPDSPSWMPPIEVEEALAMHRRDFHDELRAAHVRLAPSRAHAAGLAEFAHADLGVTGVMAPPLLAVPDRLRTPPRPGGKRLVTWGSIYPDKGLETVLDAMRAAGGDWRLQVFGEAHDADYRSEIANVAAGLDVEFSGACEPGDLAGIEADYAVFPSLCHESYGLVVDEAQALGLPMILSDLPAYREHAPEASCLFVPPGEPSALTMALLDTDRLAALLPPAPPRLQTAATAAKELLATYAAGASGAPAWAPDRELERDRAGALFRRAERRSWSMLQSPTIQPPPNDYLT